MHHLEEGKAGTVAGRTTETRYSQGRNRMPALKQLSKPE